MPRSLRSAGLAALAVGLPWLIGCSSFRSPVVEVTGATITEHTPEALRFDVGLQLTNPNAEPLPLREFSYTVTMEGRTVFSGRRSAEATLEADGTRRMRLPAVVRYEQLGWDPSSPPAVASWALRGELLYLTPGELAETLLDLNVREPRLRIAGSGELSLHDR